MPPPVGIPRPFYARVRVSNHRQVKAAFGARALTAMLAAVHDRAAAMLIGTGCVSWNQDGLDILIDDIARVGGSPSAPAGDVPSLVHHELTRRLSEAVRTDGVTVMPVIAVVMVDGAAGDEHDVVAQAEARLEALPAEGPAAAAMESQRWVRGYAVDMAVAAKVARAIAEDRVHLAWQPIVGAVSGPALLYCEGTARIVDPAREFGDGAVAMARTFVPALERTGLIRALDAHVVGLAIVRLAADPDLRLGCNVSACSAVADGWWVAVLAALDAAPDVACRLTIEFAGTAPFPNLASAIDVVRALRNRGCRIAIDDFGAGQAAIRDVAALNPDVIKIDAWFLRRLDGRQGATSLAPLIALASTLAVEVVIDGVEGCVAERLARDAGGRWLQGDFIASPSVGLSSYHASAPRDRIADAAMAGSAPSLLAEKTFVRGILFAVPLGGALWALILYAVFRFA